MANILVDKSEENIQAAEILNNESFFSSSVHCSYYSCIQLMKHIILNLLEYTERELAKEIKSNPLNSHEFYISLVTEALKEKNKDASVAFYSNIGKLKLLRVEADYLEIVITNANGSNAYKYAKGILNDLKFHFSL